MCLSAVDHREQNGAVGSLGHGGARGDAPALRGAFDRTFSVYDETGGEGYRFGHFHLQQLFRRIFACDHFAVGVNPHHVQLGGFGCIQIEDFSSGHDDAGRLEAVALPFRVGKAAAVYTG
ncbi:hypothetical protein D3C75_1020590 [compost metagenome]